jgi:hypothetical protein
MPEPVAPCDRDRTRRRLTFTYDGPHASPHAKVRSDTSHGGYQAAPVRITGRMARAAPTVRRVPGDHRYGRRRGAATRLPTGTPSHPGEGDRARGAARPVRGERRWYHSQRFPRLDASHHARELLWPRTEPTGGGPSATCCLFVAPAARPQGRRFSPAFLAATSVAYRTQCGPHLDVGLSLSVFVLVLAMRVVPKRAPGAIALALVALCCASFPFGWGRCWPEARSEDPTPCVPREVGAGRSASGRVACRSTGSC